MSQMKVLALASYPVEAAATRYRVQQFIKPLADRGIAVEIHPFLNSKQFQELYRRQAMMKVAAGLIKSGVQRLTEIVAARQADVILIQREAMLFGPPLIEWMMTNGLKRPMVLDLDDATYVSYQSPTYGALSKTLKWFSKTDDLIKWATIVTCGNRSIAEYVSSKGARARIIPTVVDTDIFQPAAHDTSAAPLVLGWIGTHSTFPYLESIFPVLSSLAKHFDFRLKIVGAGRPDVSLPDVQVENLAWDLQREVGDFQSIDIGLYPIDASLYSGKWAQGKSGFKAVQYMAVGVPFVATPVGGSAEIGEPGRTHFFASTNDEWYRSLEKLLSDQNCRQELGEAGRAHAVKYYGLQEQADKLAAALHEAAKSRGN
jgi:glycosyltransferase involved in cell wall biosynthesis